MLLFLVITEHSLQQLAKTKYIVEEYLRFSEKCPLGKIHACAQYVQKKI